jgi:radical SAM protein with 4Fe4S-binding SPASM domain
LGLRANIFTNAPLIDENLCSVFRKIPPLESIGVTACGMSQHTYEKVTRTKGFYEKSRTGLNLLLKYNIPFKIKIPYFSFTKNEINEFEDFYPQLPWEDREPGHTVFFDLRARRDSSKKNKIIEKLRNTLKESIKFLSKKKWLKQKKEFCFKFLEIPGDDLFACGAGQGGGCVDAYGRFQLCMLLRHRQTIYDLNKGSLKNALTRFFPKVRATKAQNPDYLSRCVRCFIKALCEQCPARSWMEHGTLDTPVEYYCRAAHLEAREIGLIKKGEKA